MRHPPPREYLAVLEAVRELEKLVDMWRARSYARFMARRYPEFYPREGEST